MIESEPCTGEKMNCMSAQAVPNTPYISAACAALPPMKSVPDGQNGNDHAEGQHVDEDGDEDEGQRRFAAE